MRRKETNVQEESLYTGFTELRSEAPENGNTIYLAYYLFGEPLAAATREKLSDAAANARP